MEHQEQNRPNSPEIPRDPSPAEAWQDSLREIRSTQFDIKLNVLSGTGQFMQALEREPAVRATLQAIQESEPLGHDTLETIRMIAKTQVDMDYQNPNDTALAALLLALSTAQPELGREAARMVARTPGCCYAAKLAQEIIQKDLYG